MRTTITNNYLKTHDGQEANRILRNCVHCGFCNATCPTYQILGDELDGPRGRIYLIKQILEGKEPGTKTQLHLDRCLTCRNCETTCPSGVEYGKLLGIGRKLVTEKVTRPKSQQLLHFLLRKLLLSSTLFSFTLRIGQSVRRFLPKKLRQNIPERINRKPGWPDTKHSRKVILVKGCVQPALQPGIDKAAAIAFDQIKIQSLYLKASSCCGALSHHLNAENEALSYIKQNIDTWWPYIKSGSVEAITMTASGCGVMIKEYATVLANDTEYADKAAQISALYKDPSEIIKDSPLVNLSPSTSSKPRIAFHPPCTLQHGLKLGGVIESLLTGLGYELVNFENSHLCCGSAGTYSITQKTIATSLRDNKLNAIQANHPDMIITANIGCQNHLQSGTNIPVHHWLELLV